LRWSSVVIAGGRGMGGRVSHGFGGRGDGGGRGRGGGERVLEKRILRPLIPCRKGLKNQRFY
jgi:hypothetical protein